MDTDYSHIGALPIELSLKGGFALRASRVELPKKAYLELQKHGLSEARGRGLYFQGKVKDSYYFFQNKEGKNTWLVAGIRVPHVDSGLMLDYTEDGGLLFSDTTGFFGRRMHFCGPLRYRSFNLDDKAQSLFLLSLWKNWLYKTKKALRLEDKFL